MRRKRSMIGYSGQECKLGVVIMYILYHVQNFAAAVSILTRGYLFLLPNPSSRPTPFNMYIPPLHHRHGNLRAPASIIAPLCTCNLP